MTTAVRDPEQTRETILRAAAKEIHRRGFQAASLTDILAATELTKGALYHHFPNKTALGYAVVDELLAGEVRETFIAPLGEGGDPIARLGGVLQAAMAQAGMEDLLLGCPVNNLALEMSPGDEGFRTRINQIYDDWRDGIARALEQGKATGHVEPEVDSNGAATFILGALAGCRSLAKNAQAMTPMEDCARNLQRYLETLRP
jgi:TetR/AcrR family transcriptional regulator, transcriptional repressor for nem operon